MPKNPNDTQPPEAPQQVTWQPECNSGWIVDGELPALWLDQLHANVPCEILIDLTGIIGLDSNGLQMLQKMVTAARQHNAWKVRIIPSSDSVRNMLEFANFDLVSHLEETPS